MSGGDRQRPQRLAGAGVRAVPDPGALPGARPAADARATAATPARRRRRLRNALIAAAHRGGASRRLIARALGLSRAVVGDVVAGRQS